MLSDVEWPHYCSASFAATKSFKSVRHRLFDLAIRTATFRRSRVGCGGEGRCMDVTSQLLWHLYVAGQRWPPVQQWVMKSTQWHDTKETSDKTQTDTKETPCMIWGGSGTREERIGEKREIRRRGMDSWGDKGKGLGRRRGYWEKGGEGKNKSDQEDELCRACGTLLLKENSVPLSIQWGVLYSK